MFDFLSVVFQNNPVLAIIILGLFGIGYIVNTIFSRKKNLIIRKKDLYNSMLEKKVAFDLMYSEEVESMETLPYKIENIMLNCFKIAYSDLDTNDIRRDYFSNALKTAMWEVRDYILDIVKNIDFVSYNEKKYIKFIKKKVEASQLVFDKALDVALPNFIEGLDINKFRMTASQEGKEPAFKIVKEMFDMCREIELEFRDKEHMKKAIEDSIRIYS